ncbi:hypothetical protein DL546_009306 [Coniochaeta pulveracea]|uniref:Uncharacterized protein n=1 Tax=Coniochaeta pulveracea TaxID=177199 RepID=A0A420YJ73_9PEZI|nr:hypothetical protein DL546_009306 [Coniochaeta pulveracea]
MDSSPSRPPLLISRLPLPLLLTPPLVITLTTFLLHLFLSFLRDINIPLLYSQCHARSRLHFLSRIPVLGAPSCFLVSFWLETLDSFRGRVIMATLLGFVVGLVTVTTLESKRVANQRDGLVKRPGLWVWAPFVVLGGVSVTGWGVPGLLRRGKEGETWTTTLHLSSSRLNLVAVYALPILLSVVAHGYLLYNLVTRRDDSHEVTRSTLKFILIDLGGLLTAVLYWVLVEAGWMAAAVFVVATLLAGPGAGVSLAWGWREIGGEWKTPGRTGTRAVAVGSTVGTPTEEGGNAIDEETPLLR